MTRWRENKDKRGAKATRYIFSAEQEKILYEHGWELEQNISTIAKGRALKNNPHVTAWKKKIAKDIIDRPEFTTLDLDEHSLSEWLSVRCLLLYVCIEVSAHLEYGRTRRTLPFYRRDGLQPFCKGESVSQGSLTARKSVHYITINLIACV